MVGFHFGREVLSITVLNHSLFLWWHVCNLYHLYWDNNLIHYSSFMKILCLCVITLWKMAN